MSKSTDSSRYCDTHQSWGDHHTDRCPETYETKSAAEHEWDVVQTQRRAMGQPVKPYPGDEAAARAAQGKESRKASTAVSAQYNVTCPTCQAAPKAPCRSKITRRVTDTHRARIDAAYPNNTL